MVAGFFTLLKRIRGKKAGFQAFLLALAGLYSAQALYLPIHSTGHALERVAFAGAADSASAHAPATPSPKDAAYHVADECGLCQAFHAQASAEVASPIAIVATVDESLSVALPETAFFSSYRILPPAHAPPRALPSFRS